MPLPIDPSLAVGGAEWSVAPIGGVSDATPAAAGGSATEGAGFGGILAEQIGNLERAQVQGAEAARSLATGTAQDLPSVVAAVERARLSMELASQVRTRAVEAYQEIYRTQV